MNMRLSALLLLVLISPTFAARPVAHWDVVPDQVIAKPLNVGVVAFHPDGVKVEFRIAGKLVATAERPTLNEHSKVWEYWFPFDPKQHADGPVKVEAKVIPLTDGQPAYDLEPLPLLANSGGSLTVADEHWVDANKGDDAGDGSKDSPFKSLAKAIKETKPGGTINLQPGLYSADKLDGGAKREQWTTIQAGPGVQRAAVEISGGRPGTQRLRFKDVTLFCDKDDGKYVTILYGGQGMLVWADQCVMTNKKGRHAAGSQAFNAYTAYITGGMTTEMMNGPGGRLVRDHTIDKLGSDAWSGSNKLVVNSRVIDMDRGPTEAHPDFFQSYAKSPNWCEDVILYNVRGYAGNAQGLFGGRLRNAAFVNVLYERVPTGNFLSQFSPPLENVMYFHVSIVNQNWLWRSGDKPLPPTTDVRMTNSVVGAMGLHGTMTADGLTLTHNHFINADRTMGEEASTGDPKYADPVNRDYGPKPGSPLIGTGTLLLCVPADIDGKPYGEKPNRGCFASDK